MSRHLSKRRPKGAHDSWAAFFALVAVSVGFVLGLLFVGVSS